MPREIRSVRIYVAAPPDVKSGLETVIAAIQKANQQQGVIDAAIRYELHGWNRDSNFTVSLTDEQKHVVMDSFLYVVILSKQMGPTFKDNQKLRLSVEWDLVAAALGGHQAGPRPIMFYFPQKIIADTSNDDIAQIVKVMTFVRQVQSKLTEGGLNPDALVHTVDSDEAINKEIFDYLTKIDTLNGVDSPQKGGGMRPAAETWESQVGLKYNPFTNLSAENDPKLIDYVYYHDYKDFPDISATQPNPSAVAVIFGEVGMGKSAMFKAAEHFVRQRNINPRYFVICYNKKAFNPLLGKHTVGSAPTADDHIRQITIAGLRALLKESENPLNRFPDLNDADQGFLNALLSHFEADLLPHSVNAFRKWLKLSAPNTNAQTKGLGETIFFDALCTLVSDGRFGYQKPLILVDQVGKDELGNEYDDNAAAAFIAPLIRHTYDILSDKAHFRFFLDQFLKSPLSAKPNQVRFDRVKEYTLLYDEVHLKKMVELRLKDASVYSYQPIKDLAELFASPPDLGELYTFGKPRKPRELILLIGEMIESRRGFWNADNKNDVLLQEIDLGIVLERARKTHITDEAPNVESVISTPVEQLPSLLAGLIVRLQNAQNAKEENKKFDVAEELIENMLKLCAYILLAVTANTAWLKVDPQAGQTNSDGNILPSKLANSIAPLLLDAPTIENRQRAIGHLLKYLTENVIQDSPALFFIKPIGDIFDYRLNGKGKTNRDRIQQFIEWRNQITHSRKTLNDLGVIAEFNEHLDSIQLALLGLCDLEMLVVTGVEPRQTSPLCKKIYAHGTLQLKGNSQIKPQRTDSLLLEEGYPLDHVLLVASHNATVVDLYPFIIYSHEQSSPEHGEVFMLQQAQAFDIDELKQLQFLAPINPGFKLNLNDAKMVQLATALADYGFGASSS